MGYDDCASSMHKSMGIIIDYQSQKSIIKRMKIYFILIAITIAMCIFGCAGVGGSILYPVNGKKITLSIDDKEVKEANGNK